jgi:murein DD-endopeptidase MepM/ murein hydrolase activator NlpD
VDFSTAAGVELVAVAPGAVYYAGNDSERLFGPQNNFYGNLVVIQLFDAWAGHTVYALTGHMDEVRVQTGQTVNAGDVLGTVGATGAALGPHPHLETRLDFPESYWDTRNPELWLQPNAGMGALAIRVTNSSGQYLPGMYVKLFCADGAPRTLETYWYNGVNPDDAYGENAATHVPAGYCSAEAAIPEGTVTGETTVPEGGVGFIWLKP